jgi:hypothetical protein
MEAAHDDANGLYFLMDNAHDGSLEDDSLKHISHDRVLVHHGGQSMNVGASE